MRRAKVVEFALSALGKTAQATQLAQRCHAIPSAGQNLVRVSLVAHIPDDAVFWGVVNVMQCHGELNRAQVGAEVPRGLGHAVQQITAQLIA